VEQHIVPQCYMRGFRDPGADSRMGPQIWAVDLKEGILSRRSPKGVAKLTDYYTIRLSAEQRPNQIFETELGRVEDAAAPLLVRLRDGNCRMSDSERSRFAVFIAFLFARTPSSRKNIDSLAQKMIEGIVSGRVRSVDFPHSFRQANKGSQISDGRIEEVRQQLLKPGALRARIIPEFSLQYILTIADTVARMVFDMRWRLAIPPLGRHFLASDNPVFWYDPSAPRSSRHALASPNAILTFPIGPEVALVGSWSDGPDGYHRVGDSIVDDINQLVASSADRWIIAARQDEAESALCLRQALMRRGVAVGPLRMEAFELYDEENRRLGVGSSLR
jgi:Protein of unknown function (DUF4238)